MNARQVAWRVLRLVNTEGAYANIVTPREMRHARLSRPDAGFATELIYGTLRLRGRHDAVIFTASGRGPHEIDEDVLDVLRLGTHQALELATPAHAVVNESVALAASVGLGRAKGLVNAVMRRVTERTRDEWLEAIVRDCTSSTQRLSILYSHPEWIVQELRWALVADARSDDLEALLRVNNEAAEVSLADLRRLQNPDIPPLPDMIPDERTPVSARFTGGDPSSVVRASGGLVRVQDVGSQVAALVLANAQLGREGPDDRWLDLCAGPGGKTALLAALAQSRGADVLANEPSPHRAALVRTAVMPFTNVTVVEHDGRHVPKHVRGPYSRVIVDAPCSGLGALRRRPESRWRKTPEDLRGLQDLQLELLNAASDVVAPGGIVAYVTCSPSLVETRDIVSVVMSRHSDVALVPVAPVVRVVAPGLAPVNDQNGSVQLWPHIHGTDAMFLSLFRRSR